MSITELVEAMVAAGSTPEQILAAVRVVEAADGARLAKRRASDAERQRRHRACHVMSHTSHVMSRDIEEKTQGNQCSDDTCHVMSRDDEICPSPPFLPPEVPLLFPLHTSPITTSPTLQPIHSIPHTLSGRAREFETFWAAYPRKIGKAGARRSFDRAVAQGVTLERMLAAVGAYKAAKPPDIDFCHPQTWLNQGRWDDEHQPQRTHDSRPAQPRRANGSEQMLVALAEVSRDLNAREQHGYVDTEPRFDPCRAYRAIEDRFRN